MTGWIKLHRKITDWGWYQDGNVFRVFVHLLLTANHQKGEWQGIDVERGQVVIGREKLAKTLGISEQSIRTSLNKLKSTNEITTKSTNKYTIVTINNYDDYQQDNQQTNQPLTNNQPTTNHKQECKEYKNDKNILSKDNKEFGNQDVNKLIESFKTVLGLKILDGTIKDNRQYAYLTIKKFGIQRSLELVAATYNNQWWRGRVTSLRKLYYNAETIISSAIGRTYEPNNNKVAIDPNQI